MTFRVIIAAEAERELVEVTDFYDRCRPGLGGRFARELRDFFKIVCEHPERYRFASRLTRKARLPKPWPYSVYFIIKPQSSEIIISAIWHDARNPAELRRRLK